MQQAKNGQLRKSPQRPGHRQLGALVERFAVRFAEVALVAGLIAAGMAVLVARGN